MIAVFVNCGSVVLGSIIGLLFSKKISKELSNIVQAGAGVVTLVIGFQMAFAYKSIIVLTLSIILGGIIGSWWDIDGKILALGRFLEGKFNKKPNKNQIEKIENEKICENSSTETKFNFAYAFLNASVLFCVGAMSIIGSFKAGIEKDYTLIYTKSILDGFMAIVFTAAMGPGTIFSVISILIYQGGLTLASTWLEPIINDAILTEISACGGAMIVMIGINLLKLRQLKTANYLPGIIIAAILVPIMALFS